MTRSEDLRGGVYFASIRLLTDQARRIHIPTLEDDVIFEATSNWEEAFQYLQAAHTLTTSLTTLFEGVR